MDALLYIRKTIDSSLSFRVSCRQGICGICAVNVNGVNCLACAAPVTPGTQMIIKQLTGFFSFRDLMIDFYMHYGFYKLTKP